MTLHERYFMQVNAKRECRVSHLLSNNPFPSKSRNLKTLITEALTTTVAEWNDGGAVFEPGELYIGICCVLNWPLARP